MRRLREIVAAGETALAEGRNDDAYEAFTKAMTLRPGFAPVAEAWLKACLAAGRHEEAWAAAEHLALLAPDSQAAADGFRAAGAALDRASQGARRATAIYGVIGKAKTAALKGRLGGLFRKSGPSDPLSAVLQEAVAGVTDAGLKARLGRAASAITREDWGMARQELGDAGDSGGPAVRLYLGVVALGEGQFGAALEAFEAAEAGGDGSAGLHALAARAATRGGRIELAKTHLGALSGAGAEAPLARLAAAALAEREGDRDGARDILTALEAAHPDHRSARAMAALLAGAGDFSGAAEWHGRTAERAPWLGRPFYAAAVERQLAVGTPLYAAALARRESVEVPQDERAYVGFALGRALQSAGRHEEAFAELARANALVDRYYDPAEEQAEIDAVTAHVTAEVLARAGEVDRGRGIVSVSGLPRSGSTLIAEIIARHPEAVSVGEAAAFASCLQEARRAGYPERVAEMPGEVFAALGARYLELLPPEAKGARVVVDKALFTHRDLGLFRLMLPGARFLHSARDPRDTCFSIFCQRFEGYHGYSYRQDTLAHFAHLHDAVMAHWGRVMGDAIHRVDYEALVEDTEAETRAMLDHAGLDFHPNCLDTGVSAGTVETSSAYQVRQKIYSSSIGAWKRHEAGLAVLVAGLEEKPFGVT